MNVTTTSDLWRMSATDLAEAIRSRQVSSREVIEAHLRRIEAVNPGLISYAGQLNFDIVGDPDALADLDGRDE
jgi:amidase